MSQVSLWNEQGIVISAYGEPATKGSMKLVTRGRKGMPLAMPIMLPDNTDALRRWESNVAGAALAALVGRARPVFGKTVALAVDVAFALARPRTVKREYPIALQQDDLDKLLRAVLDPLTGLVYADDAQIAQLHASKRYAKDPMALSFVGARIEVWPIRPKED